VKSFRALYRHSRVGRLRRLHSPRRVEAPVPAAPNVQFHNTKDGRMGRKEREDDSTKEFKKGLKAVGKPPKKEKEKIDKITRHLSKNEKL
jgi:hypothetical protein